jgi:hypothetical protein
MPNLFNYNFGADRGSQGQFAPYADRDGGGLACIRTF